MSGEKDYTEYMKELEQSILADKQKPVPPEIHKPEIPCRKRHRKKYRVIKLRLSLLLVTFAVIVAVIFGTVRIIGMVTSKAEPKGSGSDNAFNIENDVPKITFDYTDSTQALPETNDASAGIIINTQTNKVIAAKNSDQRVSPASTTKILTLLTAVENIDDFDDTFTMTLDITDPLYVQEASVAGFLNGESVTMRDLLYGTILPSGADAAMGLAIKIAGSEENFVALMNKKIQKLGLKNTHFTNVSGLYNENHYSTAYDMAVILDAALQNKVCKQVLSQDKPYTTASTPQHPEGLTITSTLFSYMYGTEPETATILGGKTGFVNESGYCIASYGKSNATSEEYIVVTLGNSARWPAMYGQIELYKQFAK